MWGGRLGLRPPAAPPPTMRAPAPALTPPWFRIVTDALAAGANAQRDMSQTDTNSTDSYKTLYANETNSTSKGLTVYEESYEHSVAAFLCLYYTPLLICLGCVGNLMSLFVFYRTKLRFQSTSQYLSALAVADTAFLLLLLPPWLHTVEVTGLFGSAGFCQVFVYATYVSCCVSSWLVVAFTVERFVAVIYPFRRNQVCTVRRARYTIYSIFLVSIVLNLPVLKLVLSSREECLMDQSHWRFAAIFNALDTVVTFTVPLGVIIVLNAWIMMGVVRLDRTREELTSTPASTTTAPTRCRHGRGRRAHARMQLPHTQCQKRVTKMLLIVSSVFVLLNLPAYTMRLLAYAYQIPEIDYSNRWKAIQQVALMFFNTNFGINFLLYCITGQKFRRALVGALPCAKRRVRREEAQRFAVSCRPVRATSISTSLASCSEPTNTATTNVTTNVHAVVTSGTGVASVTSVTSSVTGVSSVSSVRCRRGSGFARWIANNQVERQRRREEFEMGVFHQQTTQAQIHGTCSTDA